MVIVTGAKQGASGAFTMRATAVGGQNVSVAETRVPLAFDKASSSSMGFITPAALRVRQACILL